MNCSCAGSKNWCTLRNYVSMCVVLVFARILFLREKWCNAIVVVVYVYFTYLSSFYFLFFSTLIFSPNIYLCFASTKYQHLFSITIVKCPFYSLFVSSIVTVFRPTTGRVYSRVIVVRFTNLLNLAHGISLCICVCVAISR